MIDYCLIIPEREISMKTVGIIAEYNPFHNGHAYQIAKAKEKDVVARPYLRYQDSNGLYRTYYQDYKGKEIVFGGCSTNYTDTWGYLNDRGYFPTKN